MQAQLDAEGAKTEHALESAAPRQPSRLATALSELGTSTSDVLFDAAMAKIDAAVANSGGLVQGLVGAYQGALTVGRGLVNSIGGPSGADTTRQIFSMAGNAVATYEKWGGGGYGVAMAASEAANPAHGLTMSAAAAVQAYERGDWHTFGKAAGTAAAGLFVAVFAAAKTGSKKFGADKQALVDMAKADKRTGITASDMQAYKDLNRTLKEPFPIRKARGPEAHPNRPHGQHPHGHVGPVDHIPIVDE